MHFNRNNIIIVAVSILLTACANQLAKSGSYIDSFKKDPLCMPTQLNYEFVSDPNEYWKHRLVESTKIANVILVSDEFAKSCQKLKMNRTNGKTIQEVCREIACSDARTLKFGFFDNKNTTAIAREVGNGIVEFNIAKPNSNAGSPGNIAHEFTHTLGYTHFTNFSWFGKYSVPYEIGGLIDSMSSK